MPDDLTRAGDTTPAKTGLVTVDVEHGRDAVIVHVAGEVDMATAPEVSEALYEVITASPRALVIDLTEVSFLASSGLQMLTDVRQAVDAAGVPLWLAAQSRPVLRSMEITGVLDAFAVLPSVSAVLAAIADIPCQAGTTRPGDADRDASAASSEEPAQPC
ncbi:MAG: STAS domain-containing protein [Kutzneria sp.]|nr:STAS domain-containing protein [Kutzneria sp.]MBV9844345.1 STAS domain-containing protein [Kutzneria sp.]